MRVWRIRLVGHELYYQPVKGRWSSEKSNLSPRGKVYLTKPSMKHVGSCINVSHSIAKKYSLKTVESSWKRDSLRLSDGYQFEIKEYELTEV